DHRPLALGKPRRRPEPCGEQAGIPAERRRTAAVAAQIADRLGVPGGEMAETGRSEQRRQMAAAAFRPALRHADAEDGRGDIEPMAFVGGRGEFEGEVEIAVLDELTT